jgi:FkbM family methyltransferase
VTRVVELRAGLEPLERVVRIEGDPDDTSVMAVLSATQAYEPHVVRFLRHVVTRDSVVLDVGANIGVHTVVAALLCPDGHVYAFEPGSHHRTFLERNVERNGLRNVTVVPAPLMDAAVPVVLNMPATFQAGAWISTEAREGVTEPTVATTLDAWAEQHRIERCDVVKVDVEGCERLVLGGGARALQRWQPLLLVECNAVTQRRFRGESLAPLARDLQRFGRELYALGERGPLRRVLSPSHLEALASDGGVVDVVAVPDARRDAVAGIVGSRALAVRSFAALRWRSNRWRRPPNALVHDPHYQLDIAASSLQARRGDRVRVGVTVHNTGRQWLSDAYRTNPTFLSYRWVRGGEVLDGVGGPRVSFGSLRPGASSTVDLDVVVDREPGDYELDVGVIQEAVAWLVDLAPVNRCRLPITVTA